MSPLKKYARKEPIHCKVENPENSGKTKRPALILVSGSPSRKQQLKDLGFVFTLKAHGIDEEFYKKQSGLSPRQICRKIARAKVEQTAKEHPYALVLSGDQMAVLKGEIFNKPYTPERAVKSIMKLQGTSHKLFTALEMRYRGQSFSHVEVNKMFLRKLTKSQIEQYVKKARPLHCAGSYALERYGIALFEKIESADHSAIIGFPLTTLINQMIKWNIILKI